MNPSEIKGSEERKRDRHQEQEDKGEEKQYRRSKTEIARHDFNAPLQRKHKDYRQYLVVGIRVAREGENQRAAGKVVALL